MDDIRISRESRFWHHRTHCRGRYCAVHNPSNHHMKDWPQQFEPKLYEMYRICPHGHKHHDPDHIDYMVSSGKRTRGSFGYTIACMCGRPPFPQAVKKIIAERLYKSYETGWNRDVTHNSYNIVEELVNELNPILEAHYNAKSR